MSGLLVAHPGPHCLIQDGGRFGQARLGLTEGGPADRPSFEWANRLCGNPLDSQALEITLGGARFISKGNMTLAITGAPLSIRVNGQSQEMWCSFDVVAGDVIELHRPTMGIRSYLAVAGGFQVAEQFGSAATVVRENMGGLDGKPLQAEQLLPVVEKTVAHWGVPFPLRPVFPRTVSLRVVEGYQVDSFDADQRRAFYAGQFQVSQHCDRMGYRLTGPAIQCRQQQLISEGIGLGAVQLPPDGQPIVMMQDHQTIGGYPKMGSVLSLDLALLAQALPGTMVRFSAISQTQAQQIISETRRQFDAAPLISLS